MEMVKERFEEIVRKLLQPRHVNLLPETTFKELGADSIDEVELVMAAEEEFGIEISDDDAEKLKTLGEAIAYIEAK